MRRSADTCGPRRRSLLVPASALRTIRASLLAAAIQLAAGLLASESAADPELSWRALASFTARGEARALDLNRANAGDSGFDPARGRLMLDAAVSENVAVFGQFIIDDAAFDPFRLYGFYALLSGLLPGDNTIEVGRIPTLFGTYGSRNYEDENPLIGTPLLYQYHTTVRGDQIPVSAEALVAQSGRGQFGVSHRTATGEPTGSSSTKFGAPFVYDVCWDYGVALLGTRGPFEYALGITQGTLGLNSPGRDVNNGRQIVGRIGFTPVIGLRVSASGAQGPYLSRVVEPFLPAGADLEDFAQRAAGLSLDWSAGRYVFASEVTRNVYESPWIPEDLGSLAWYVEGKYTVLPGGYVAARFDRVTFDEIAVTEEGGNSRQETWDADVQRCEAAVGYWVSRNLLMRGGIQFWDEDGGDWDSSQNLVALQAVVTY